MRPLIEELKKIAKSLGVKKHENLSLILRNKIDLDNGELTELENLLSSSKSKR